MAPNHVSFGNCLIFALALAEVTSWTIDLPEVRKFFFEKNKAEKRKAIEKEGIYYSNIESNSKHHETHNKYHEDAAYAKEYGYQSYMEKKVNNIVYNGSVYLEGLRKSLLNYTRHLEGCKDEASQNLTWLPPIATLPKPGNQSSCAEATRTSEHVRRLAQLALVTTKELQDVAYSRKYEKGDPHELSQQENELILKLAWFLDRIAHYTGYEPQPKDFLHDHTSTPAPSPPPPPMFAAPSPELKARLLRCLKEKSSEPAVDRCRYNETDLPALRELLAMNENITAIPTMPTPSLSASPADVTAEPSVELLVASDNRTPFSNLPPKRLSLMSAVRSKRSLSMSKPEVPKTRQRADDPMLHFLKYYTKHKVWQGANLDNGNSKAFETYDVKNNLGHNIHKRAVNKKYSHLLIPEDPFQDLSKYVKHKTGVNYIKDEAQLEKIRAMLEEMNKKPSKLNLRKLSKLLRFKRSLKYEQNVDKPRESVDPQKDISYYIKNKPGTNQNNDLVQAVLVRAGLEQIFNTGNIEVVRRYGSNYNPLIPAPFFAGVAKTMADF